MDLCCVVFRGVVETDGPVFVLPPLFLRHQHVRVLCHTSLTHFRFLRRTCLARLIDSNSTLPEPSQEVPGRSI